MDVHRERPSGRPQTLDRRTAQEPGPGATSEGIVTRAAGVIPSRLRLELAERLRVHAEKQWKDRCARVEVRFRGRDAQGDAYCYDEKSPGKEESVPTHLCRL